MMHVTTTRRPTLRRRTAGFTFIEVLFALATLAVAATVVTQSVVISSAAVTQAEAEAIALEEARGMADRIACTKLSSVQSIWGAGGSEGPAFVVDELLGPKATGRIAIVTNEMETDPELKAAFGLPRDLDGNGDATSTDVSTTARVLPVLVEVSWGHGNDRKVTLPVIVVR